MDIQVTPQLLLESKLPALENESNPQLTLAPDDDYSKRNQPTAQEYIPETINISHVDDADQEDDTLSTISGLTLPQEAFDVLSAPPKKQEEKDNIGNKTRHHQKKVKNKVQTIGKKRAGTVDLGDDPLNRAQALRIVVVRNTERLAGTYSGALSPRNSKPFGVGVIKFDNGDMYMGDMKDGNMHGHGTLVSRGMVLRGEFQENLFVC